MTYDDLVNQVRLQTDSGPGTPSIPVFVEFAESYFNTTIKNRKATEFATLAVVVDGNKAYAELPADFNVLRSAYTSMYPARPLQGTTPDNIVIQGQLSSTTQYFSIIGDRIYLAPPPTEDGTTLNLTYYTTLAPLSESMQSNWLLASAPDIYYYRVLYENAAFLVQPERAAAYQGIVAARIRDLNAEEASAWNNSTVVNRRVTP